MKLALILSLVLAALVSSATAATATENAAMSAAATNTDDSHDRLVQRPDIVKGDGFTIKRSQTRPGGFQRQGELRRAKGTATS